MELFLGFLFAAVVVLLPLFSAFYVVGLLFSPRSAEYAFSIFGLELVLFYLLGYGYYRAWRYRLSRTSWRGVRFSLVGNGHAYALKMLGWGALTLMSFGLLAPVTDLRLTGHILRDMRFGDRAFHFDANARSLYLAFLASYVLGVIVYIGVLALAGAYLIQQGVFERGERPSPETIAAILPVIVVAMVAASLLLALTASIYIARRLKVIGGGLSFEGVRFKLDATFGSYFGLVFTNLLLVTFTLGFAMPIAELRVFHYMFSRLSAEGLVDLAAIVQSSADRPKTGEGLAEAFGFGTV